MIAVAEGSGQIYIGGDFSWVGRPTGSAAAIGATTGRPDLAMPAISGPGYSEVDAVVSDGVGGWYIGGGFGQVGSVERHNLVHVLSDKTVDPNFDPNANGNVLALAVSGSTIFAAGSFSHIGGVDRNNIAALDAITGNATPWNPNANATVSALAVSGSTVYAGGAFNGTDSIGGADRNFIAALDATTGNATSWNPNANNSVFALAAAGSKVYAGGFFNGTHSIGGADRNRIAALDGTTGEATSWNPNANSTVFALAVSGSTVYAGGAFNGTDSIGGADRNYVAALKASTGNATSWSPSANNNVFAITVSGSTVYIGGAFFAVGGDERNHIAGLDVTSGNVTSWNPNTSDDVFALSVSGTTVYVGGKFTIVNGVYRHDIAALNATTGAPTSWSPIANGFVEALAVSGSTVYVGGEFNSIGGAARNNIAALDANAGKATSWNPNASNGVRALAVSGSTVYAGGFFNGTNSIGGADRNHIAALNAATGQATSWNPNANNSVIALAVSGSTVYAGGFFNGTNSIGGADRNFIAALDATTGNATSWNPNANNNVLALAVSGSTVYAGGQFSGVNAIGGVDRNYIAALDATTGAATSWDPNASGFVEALAVSGGAVYVGGGYNSIGGADRNDIAALDSGTGVATSWDPNADGGVFALAVSGGTVYAGGDFLAVASRPESHFAAFAIPPANTQAPAISGTPAPGHTLTCSKGTWSGSTPQATTRRWLRDGTPIAGQTASAYVVNSTDAGHSILC
ncbi:MAG TPA: hypothetical protein VNN79_16335, partial [Actinomycetota bacterium]|nr:hypothetical protein [Actinomycetota bacterium]